MFNEPEDPYLTWGVALREDTYTCRRECMLATNAYCNRVFVRGTSSPPLVPTFVAPVYLFTSVHAHADSRTLSLVLTRMSRVTSSLFSTSSFLSLSYFSSFSFSFSLFFCFDFFPLFSWFISFSTSFYLFSMFTSLFFLRCGISSFFFILPLSFCHPFLSLFIFVSSLLFFLNDLSSTSFFLFATFPFTIRISSSLTCSTLSSFHPLFPLIFLFLVSSLFPPVIPLLFTRSFCILEHSGKFVPSENGEELRYFFIMRILTGSHRDLVSILVSALSKGRSIFTVAEQRIRRKKKERWPVEIFSGRKSRAAINSPLKRNRSGTF